MTRWPWAERQSAFSAQGHWSPHLAGGSGSHGEMDRALSAEGTGARQHDGIEFTLLNGRKPMRSLPYSNIGAQNDNHEHHSP